MKTKVLIIEDNVYKFFTTKQVLESQLKLEIQVVRVQSGRELLGATAELNPDMLVFRPHGGVTELLNKLKKRNTNRRNTEITLVVAHEMEDELVRRLQEFVSNFPRRVDNAA